MSETTTRIFGALLVALGVALLVVLATRPNQGSATASPRPDAAIDAAP